MRGSSGDTVRNSKSQGAGYRVFYDKIRTWPALLESLSLGCPTMSSSAACDDWMSSSLMMTGGPTSGFWPSKARDSVFATWLGV